MFFWTDVCQKQKPCRAPCMPSGAAITRRRPVTSSTSPSPMETATYISELGMAKPYGFGAYLVTVNGRNPQGRRLRQALTTRASSERSDRRGPTTVDESTRSLRLRTGRTVILAGGLEPARGRPGSCRRRIVRERLWLFAVAQLQNASATYRSERPDERRRQRLVEIERHTSLYSRHQPARRLLPGSCHFGRDAFTVLRGPAPILQPS